MPSLRHRSAMLLLVAVLFCASPLFGGIVGCEAKPPNVLFILSEDLGYGDLGCYGHPYARTPNLDRLASEGTRFEGFYVAGMTCAPSRAGFMTGRYPVTFPNKVDDFGAQGVDTVTDVLSRAGYKTGHFGKWHIGPDEASGTYGIDRVEVIGANFCKKLGKDTQLFEAADDFIAEVKDDDQPWYINLWTHVAHSPVTPPQFAVDYFGNVTVSEQCGRTKKKGRG